MARVGHAARALSALLFAHLATNVWTAGVDLTLQANFGGCQVVEAVLTKLLTSGVFPSDNGFLRRIAYAETEAGGANSGGPWGATAAMLSATQNTSMASVKRLIEAVRNSSFLRGASGEPIDWGSVKEADLVKPLYSAIAARLYLQIQLGSGSALPVEVSMQASFWASRYNTNGSVSIFLNRTRKLDDECACKASIDMVFVVDESGSVGQSGFTRSLNFVLEVVKDFDIGPDSTRVGLITYSSSVRVRFGLTTYENESSLLDEITRTISKYNGGSTATAPAIRTMIEQGFNLSIPSPSPSIPTTAPSNSTNSSSTTPTESSSSLSAITLKSRVGIVITDGKANSGGSVLPPSLAAQKLGINMFAIGVGGYDVTELKQIASDPDEAHVFTVNDYSAIDNIRAAVRQRSCQASAPIQIGQPITGGVKGNETTYGELPFPDGGVEITLELSTVSGSIQVYSALDVPNPGPAYYDQSMTVPEGQTGFMIISPDTSRQEVVIQPNSRARRQTASSSSPSKVYFSITGVQASNSFNMQTQEGRFLPSVKTTSPTTTDMPSGATSLKNISFTAVAVSALLFLIIKV